MNTYTKRLIAASKALGKAIERGDPQDIANRWGNVADLIKESES